MPKAKATTATTDGTVRDRYELYSEFLQEKHGVKVSAEHLALAIRNYGNFQRSDVNRSNNELRKSQRAARTTKRAEATPQTAAKPAPKGRRARSGDAGPKAVTELLDVAGKRSTRATKRTTGGSTADDATAKTGTTGRRRPAAGTAKRAAKKTATSPF